jgi:hypothetical protein
MEGLSSNSPDLVSLRECLETHEDDSNLLYLTDSEASLSEASLRCGSKINLPKTPGTDVLKEMVIKLQKRYSKGSPRERRPS